MSTVPATRDQFPSAPLPGSPSIWRTPGFPKLLVALGVSQAGDWLYNIALLALVFERTGSARMVALASAARIAPMLVVGPFGGVIADRLPPRVAMVGSDLLRLACMALLTVVAALGLPVSIAIALAALGTAAAAPYPACVAATVPRLVSSDRLPAANAARTAVANTCIVAGPGAGAVLLLVGSPAAAFAVNGATFLTSAALVLTLPRGCVTGLRERAGRPGQVRDEGGLRGVLADLYAGAQALRRSPVALRLLGADVLASGVYGMLTVVLLVLSRRLGMADHGYGYLMAAIGLGGVIGAPLASRSVAFGVGGAASARRPVAAGLVCIALALSVAGVATPTAVVIGCCVALGVASVVIEVAADTALQQDLPEEYLARAYGLVMPLCCAAMVAGALGAPALLATAGLPATLAALACLAVLYAWRVAAPPASPRALALGEGSSSNSTPAR